MEKKKKASSGKVILCLQRDEVTTILVTDWGYPFAPTTYYNRTGVLGVEEYQWSHDKGNRSYYKKVRYDK